MTGRPYSLWVCPEGHIEEHPELPVIRVLYCMRGAEDAPPGQRLCGHRMSRRIRYQADVRTG